MMNTLREILDAARKQIVEEAEHDMVVVRYHPQINTQIRNSIGAGYTFHPDINILVNTIELYSRLDPSVTLTVEIPVDLI